jgi:hypothetical protein
MALEFKKKQGTGSVSVKSPTADKEAQEPVGEPVTEVHGTPMANVGLQVGVTKNLGNFENVKITVSCYIPCEPTAEALEQAWEACELFCDTKMTNTLKENGLDSETE